MIQGKIEKVGRPAGTYPDATTIDTRFPNGSTLQLHSAAEKQISVESRPEYRELPPNRTFLEQRPVSRMKAHVSQTAFLPLLGETEQPESLTLFAS
jgi:hypothetical protein